MNWTLGIEELRRTWQKMKAAQPPPTPAPAAAPAATAAAATAGAGDAATPVFRMSPKLMSIMDASFAITTWDNFQRSLHDPTVPFTLCHSDFHASNALYVANDAASASAPANGVPASTASASASAPGRVVFVDWSEAGLWEPCADLGQTVISDIRPSQWAVIDERAVLRDAYWRMLVAKGVPADAYPFERCWEQYCRAPVERWLWFVIILSVFNLPPAAMQYFHDQTLAFIEAHNPQPAYIIKPGVTLLY